MMSFYNNYAREINFMDMKTVENELHQYVTFVSDMYCELPEKSATLVLVERFP